MALKCNCRTNAVTKTPGGRDLCGKCFCAAIEKRVRRQARINRAFSKNDKIIIVDNGSKEAKINEYLVKQIIGEMPAEIIVSKKMINGYNKIVLPNNLDKEIIHFLTIFASKNKKSELKEKLKELSFIYRNGKITYIKLLRSATKEECRLFAEIKGFKYQHRKEEKTRLKEMIDEIERKQPGRKFGLLKSIDELRKAYW